MILDADFSVFTHDESGSQIIRSMQYSIPEELFGHLQVVHPVTTFAVSTPRLSNKRVSPPVVTKERRQSACTGYIDPQCLEQLYGIPTTSATSTDSLLVTGYNNESPSVSDMEVRQNYSYDQHAYCRLLCVHTRNSWTRSARVTNHQTFGITTRSTGVCTTRALQDTKQYVRSFVLSQTLIVHTSRISTCSTR